MAYLARVVEIIIASPGDVSEERQIVREVVAEWNAAYARERAVILHPVGWETHSSPELSGRPQQLINDRLLTPADILVGIFWTRVGSPTGKAISGSIEEIDEHRMKGKPVMLYFSKVPVVLDSLDQAQYEQLTEFKKWALTEGLVESFESHDDFRNKFRQQLPILLRDNPYLKEVLAEDTRSDGGLDAAAGGPRTLNLGADARALLTAAVADRRGSLMVVQLLRGTEITVGRQRFGDPANQRSVAQWEAAVEELRDGGLIRDTTGGGVYTVTDAGYRLVETTS